MFAGIGSAPPCDMSLGIYLHYPFCRNRCSYCDFYKELYDSDLQIRFFDALTIETELIARKYAQGRRVISLFIGGGTPSLMPSDRLAAWVKQVRQLFDVEEDMEFSIETNPESVTLELLTAFRSIGINRPLFGIQSFNSDLLMLMDRKHSPRDSHRAIYHTNATGFRNFGVDLIFGLPGQTANMLEADLEQLFDLAPPHISFYQLTIEEGTRLASQVADGRIRIPEEEMNLALYRLGVRKMEEAGYKRYEVSSFAQPGYECRHNLGYWEGAEYIGLGPSAHSFVDNQRSANQSSLSLYLESLHKQQLPRIIDKSGIEERMTEAIMLGLRLTRGISREQFQKRFGCSLQSRLNRKQYDLLVESGHLISDDDSLRLSGEGFNLIDEITGRLLSK